MLLCSCNKTTSFIPIEASSTTIIREIWESDATQARGKFLLRILYESEFKDTLTKFRRRSFDYNHQNSFRFYLSI